MSTLQFRLGSWFLPQFKALKTNQHVSQSRLARCMFFSSGTWSWQLDSVVNGVAVSVGPDLPVNGPREGCEYHSAVLAHHIHPLVLPPSSEEEQGGLAHSSTLPARNPPPIFHILFYFKNISSPAISHHPSPGPGVVVSSAALGVAASDFVCRLAWADFCPLCCSS